MFSITLPANNIQLFIKDRDKYAEWLKLQNKALNSKAGYLTIQVDLPKKPRTTGEKSQCNFVNGAIQQIAKETGNDFSDLKMYFKMKAVSRGYPLMMREGKIVYSKVTGEPLPESEANVSTVEAGYLIDEIIQEAKELGIRLQGV
jgi:hypothetical protein